MRASSIIISGLLGLGATATSFISTGTLDGGFSIPDDIPDGVYSVSYDDSGLAVHTAIERRGSRGSRHRRPSLH